MSEDMFVSLSACPSVHLYVCIFVCMSKRRRRGRRVGENPSTQFAFQFFPFVRMQGCQFFVIHFLKTTKR